MFHSSLLFYKLQLQITIMFVSGVFTFTIGCIILIDSLVAVAV